MYGQGLVKGLKITLKHILGKQVTRQYPEERPPLFPRFHGTFDLDVDKCIACGLCKNACPNRVIALDTVKGEDGKRKLASYCMDLQHCLFCGFCVENCPTGALKFNHEFELACYRREDIPLKLLEKKVEQGVN